MAVTGLPDTVSVDTVLQVTALAVTAVTAVTAAEAGMAAEATGKRPLGTSLGGAIRLQRAARITRISKRTGNVTRGAAMTSGPEQRELGA
jgi:hypothetical protein